MLMTRNTKSVELCALDVWGEMTGYKEIARNF